MRKRVVVGIGSAVALVSVAGVVVATSWRSGEDLPAGPCSRQWTPIAGDESVATGVGRVPPVETVDDSARAAAPDRQRPNVLVLMVDDMRADELRGPWMDDTRRLIADQGVTFRNSFSPLPLCGPARASFLSGEYAHNTGVQDNDDPSALQLFDDGNTLPVWLRHAGYSTALLGKYLNGYGGGVEPSAEPTLPEWRTPEEMFGDGPTGYVPPGWEHWYASFEPTTYHYRDTQLSDDGSGVIDLGGRYQTSAYADLGSRLVSRLAAERRPFFLDLSFTAPHSGWPHEDGDPAPATPARLGSERGRYDDRITTPRGVVGEPCNENKPSAISDDPPLTRDDQAGIVEVVRQRAESLATVDDAVARVLGALKRSGELGRTYVLFTSDNGFLQGEFRQSGGKGIPYEPAIRTPTLVRGPGIEPGIVRSQPFTTIDFAPTIADMAGVPAGARVDGKSLLSAATGADRGWRRPILTDTGPGPGGGHYGYGVRVPGFAYHELDDDAVSRELYDLSADPYENHNVVADPRYEDTVKRMARLLDRLRGCGGEACRSPR